jgi:hypothetical protein
MFWCHLAAILRQGRDLRHCLHPTFANGSPTGPIPTDSPGANRYQRREARGKKIGNDNMPLLLILMSPGLCPVATTVL